MADHVPLTLALGRSAQSLHSTRIAAKSKMAASSPLFTRAMPLNRLLLFHLRHRLGAGSVTIHPRSLYCSAAAMAEPAKREKKLSSSAETFTCAATKLLKAMKLSKYHQMSDDPDYRRWKDKEEEILRDIEPIVALTKEILHSDRYLDGEHLTIEDEKAVVEKLLAYHPHSEDKVGCGIDSIMVDRHPQFRHSRCLFVVRTDGIWIDFSYQKCLKSYIRLKYPSYAERFIQEHYKRGGG